MEWWSVFYKVRKVAFAVIAIASLLWAAALSIYIARMWHHLMLAQRIMVLIIIGANFFTALLLYLMIVVVLRVWLDLARTVFLMLIHVGSALVFTLFGANFSCDTFPTKSICKHVDLAFEVGSWVMTGLILGYIIYLLVMLRIPRPIPKITPNLLLDDPVMSRRSSTSSFGSVTSTTGLLRNDTVKSNYSTRSAQTITKKYFVTNVTPTNGTYTARPSTIRTGRGRNYGAMGSPRGSPTAGYSTATRAPQAAPTLPSTPRIAARRQSASTYTTSRPASLLMSPSRPLPVPPIVNPFLDPISRRNTPESAFSALTFGSSTTVQIQNSQYQPGPDMTPLARSNSLYPVPDAAWTNGHLSPGAVTSSHNQLNFMSAGPALRAHTATPYSIHSVAPSMYFTDAIGQTHHQLPPAHIRAHSDPIWRPHTTAPAIQVIDPDAPLPNPFPMVGTSEVRRFGTVPNGNFYTGHGGTYVNAQRNATHLAGALGRTPPRAEAAAVSPDQWKQLVYTAATGRSL